MKARAFERPDGSLIIFYPNYRKQLPTETEAEFLARVYARTMSADPQLAGLSFVDMDQSDVPPTVNGKKDKRHAWRLNPQGKIIVDPTVPEPTRPDQGFIDDIENATTIGQLKSAVVRWVKK